MRKLRSLFIAAIAVALLGPTVNLQPAYAHCQIPCGIYGDQTRFVTLNEHITTIEKSMNEINELAKDPQANANQLVRWVMNKETHAQNIISTISDYFLTQRVKPNQKDYTERLARHHAVIVAAMQAKQQADMKTVNKLREHVQALSPYYPASK